MVDVSWYMQNYVVKAFRRWVDSWVENTQVDVEVKTPNPLVPLILREAAVASIELAWVLGCELLCGDWESPETRSGVCAVEVSILGSMGVSRVCKASGPPYNSFSTLAICLTYENLLRKFNWSLTRSANRSHSLPLSCVSIFSAQLLALMPAKNSDNTYERHSCHIDPESDLEAEILPCHLDLSWFWWDLASRLEYHIEYILPLHYSQIYALPKSKCASWREQSICFCPPVNRVQWHAGSHSSHIDQWWALMHTRGALAGWLLW